jgi:hypothetical protein
VPDCSKPTISGRTPLKTHAVELQSPLLVAALKNIVKEEDMFLEVSQAAWFEEPFKPLFFGYHEIVSLLQSTTDDTLLQHLQLLVNVLNDLFGDLMHTLANLKKSRLITYELLWTHFPCGSLVYSSTTDCERVCKVISTNYMRDDIAGLQLVLSCQEISFDGQAFTWRPVRLAIKTFPGNQPVEKLPNFPLALHPERKLVEERLKERARKVLDYQELCYREYEGVGLYVKGCDLIRYNVCSAWSLLFVSD